VAVSLAVHLAGSLRFTTRATSGDCGWVQRISDR